MLFRSDGLKFVGEVKFRDPKTNIAIFKISANNLSTAQFEEAANLETAQRLIYLGRSNVKFEHEAITGFVTQSLANQLGTTKQIFSDAQLSADYSGGPIINLSGRVVGMTLENGKTITAEDLQTLLTNYLNQNKNAQ